VQPGALGTTNLVDRLVEMLNDVKAVQDVQSMSCLLGHDRKIGLPHVAADESQAAEHLRAQYLQAAPQGGFGSSPSHP